MIEKICLLLIVFLAIMAIMTISLRRAVILMAIYSLICSFIYLLHNAPDVAIAEAAIGAAFITMIYWVAIKRQKAIRIYYLSHVKDENEEETEYLPIIKLIEQFLQKKELEPYIVQTDKNISSICEIDDYNYILEILDKKIILYGRENDHHFDELEKILNEKNEFQMEVRRVKECVPK